MSDATQPYVLPDIGPAARRNFDLFLASIGQGFNAWLERASRRTEIERLEALSDTELAARGLSRGEIPRHVYRDLLGF